MIHAYVKLRQPNRIFFYQFYISNVLKPTGQPNKVKTQFLNSYHFHN